MSEARYMVGDVFERMAEIPDQSVDLIVTSPPFLALRSYLPADHPDKHLEIGSEATPAAYLSTMLALTREWRRVLAPHGSLCVELGDTYSGSGGGAGGDYGDGGLREGQPRFRQGYVAVGADGVPHGGAYKESYGTSETFTTRKGGGNGWPLAKSLCLLPTLYPASLAYGRNLLNPDDTCEPWRVRNLIVWHRPNPPVGALGDKVRPSTSYITTACVSGSRWFDLDAERTPHVNDRPQATNGSKNAGKLEGQGHGFTERTVNEAGAPPLDCWTIPTAPYTGSHYATFPPALPRRLINLMCPRQVCVVCGEPRRRMTSDPIYTNDDGSERVDLDEAWRHGRVGLLGDALGKRGHLTRQSETLGWTDCDCVPPYSTHDFPPGYPATPSKFRRGIVLDPFAGSGTTLMAASELGRDSIGIDLDPRNLQLAQERCGMFLTEVDA